MNLKGGPMAHHSNLPLITPVDAMDLGLRFLDARRSQNLSWMKMVEQSLRTLADVQRSVPGGDAFARLSTAHAGVLRDTARVYGLATTHLAR
jgi:hypothetical protein